MKQYSKLVRDKIPEIIRSNSEEPKTRILGDDEYKKALLDKLYEELAEFVEAQNLEERADIEEVLLALDALMGFSPEALEEMRHAKAIERGSFEQRIFLESVEE